VKDFSTQVKKFEKNSVHQISSAGPVPNAGWVVNSAEFLSAVQVPQMAPKQVSWAQGTAHSLENFIPLPTSAFPA